MKKGLILEGGAMRGLFTAGIIDVFMENGISFDGMIGVSAGAAFGCNFKSRQIGRALRYNKNFCRDKRYCSLWSLIKTGDMYGADFCYRELPNEIDIFDSKTFDNNPLEFFVVCTDVLTGKPVYKKLDKVDTNTFDWIRASASMPLVSRVVEVENYKLLDGGMADSVPLKFFESIGYNKNVVVLTQPLEYVKKKNHMLPLMKIFLSKYPKAVETIAKRHIVYNETTKYIREKESDGDVFVIRPAERLPVSRTEKNPENLQKAYDIGRKTALSELDRIKTFLNA